MTEIDAMEPNDRPPSGRALPLVFTPPGSVPETEHALNAAIVNCAPVNRKYGRLSARRPGRMSRRNVSDFTGGTRAGRNAGLPVAR